MNARIQKWGNSLAVRIPKAFADETQLSDKSSVEIAVVDGKLIITPIKAPQYTLEELVAGITDENRHEEFQTSPAVGKEIIDP